MTVEMPVLDALTEIERKWVSTLYEVANNNPEFEYPRKDENPDWWSVANSGDPCCRYFLNNGTPACVWGNVFSKLEISQAEIREKVGISWIVDELAPLAAGLVDLFTNFQVLQDDGCTWGDALARFDDSLRGYLAIRAVQNEREF